MNMIEAEPQAHELLDHHVMDNPYAFYSKLHRHPVWRIPDTDVFLVSSYQFVTEATERVSDFSSTMNCFLYRDANGTPGRLMHKFEGGDVLATVDPPRHALHKQAIFPELVSRRMLLLEPKVVDWAENAVRTAVAKGAVDFMEDVANIVPITVIAHLIGLENPDFQALLKAAFDSTALLAGALSREELLQNIVRSDEVGAYLGRQLSQATSDSDSLLSAVSRAVTQGVMTFAEGIIMMHTLLSAGGESTTSLIGSAAKILADDQELQARLRAEPQLIPKFVEEVLRFESPFRSHMRSVHKNTSLGGVSIPAGATMLLLWGAANRDPDAFPQADKFDLMRRNRQLAFGRGIHTCIGAPLARLEARVVLDVLLKRTSAIRPDPARAPHWERNLLVRRYRSLPLVLEA